MASSRKNQLFPYTFFVWGILAAILWVTKHMEYGLGVSIGVLTAALNFSSLLTRIEKREKENKAEKRSLLTGLFFARYLLIAAIFFVLIRFQNHLTGFFIGFLSLYVVLFAAYVKRMKAGA